MESVVDIQKTCLYCVQQKPLNEFVKGRMVCKICYKDYMRQYYRERKNDIIEKQKSYYNDNKEKLKSYSKSYYQKNKETLKKNSLQKYYQKKEEKS